jgi:hypothetical protein
MICVVLLQNGVGCVEGETGSCSKTGVLCDVDGTDEVSIKVEDTTDIEEESITKVEEPIDIKDEFPEAISFQSIKTEHEVRLWGECEVVADMLLGHSLSQKGNFEIILNYFLHHVIICVPFSF